MTSLIQAKTLISAIGFSIVSNINPAFAQAYEDDRQAIIVSAEERGELLGEMRGFLETVQGIVYALTEEDMVAIAELASASGMRLAAGTPAELTAKLPEDFRVLGVSTHRLFDGIAQEATDMGDPEAVVELIAGLLGNCTACHASYRFEISAPN